MSRSTPTTPRQVPSETPRPEHQVVTTQYFSNYFRQAWNLKCPKVMDTALQKITKLEIENRILQGELRELRQKQTAIFENLDKRISRFEDNQKYVGAIYKGYTMSIDQVKSQTSSLEASTNTANLELKSAHKVLEASVLQLQSIAKWKVDIERFEKVKWELENYVLKLKTYEKDVQSMKKQKYKVQSKVSQLENTITRQAESMHLDLKNIKKQKKKTTKGERRVEIN